MAGSISGLGAVGLGATRPVQDQGFYLTSFCVQWFNGAVYIAFYTRLEFIFLGRIIYSLVIGVLNFMLQLELLVNDKLGGRVVVDDIFVIFFL